MDTAELMAFTDGLGRMIRPACEEQNVHFLLVVIGKATSGMATSIRPDAVQAVLAELAVGELVKKPETARS